MAFDPVSFVIITVDICKTHSLVSLLSSDIILLCTHTLSIHIDHMARWLIHAMVFGIGLVFSDSYKLHFPFR